MLILNTFNDLGKGGVEGSIPSRGTIENKGLAEAWLGLLCCGVAHGVASIPKSPAGTLHPNHGISTSEGTREHEHTLTDAADIAP